VRCIFLVLNKCTKYCQKKGISVQNIVKKKGKKKHKCTKYCKKKGNMIAMHFFSIK